MTGIREHAAVLVLASALACVGLRDGIGPHDEGLVLQAAGRMAGGQLPYRDFWWNYGPGEPALLALLVKAFGPSLLVWRVVRVLAGGAVAVLCAALARRLGASGWWAPAAGVAAGSAVAWPLTPGPTVPALVPALAALLLASRRRSSAVEAHDRRLAEPSSRRCRTRGVTHRRLDADVAAGVLCGVAAWLRPELGVAAALGALALRRSPRLALTAAGSAALLYLPFVLAAPGEFAHDVLGFARIQDLQRLAFPLDPPSDPNKAFEVLFPALLVLAAAAWAVLGRARPLALLPLVLGGLAYLLARTDEFHLVPLAAVLAPALAVAAARAGSRPPRVLLGAMLALLALHGVERQAGRLLHPGALAAVPGGVGDGVRTSTADAAALRVLVPRLRGLGRPLLVVPPRMDRVRVGDPLLNVIADLPNPTRYDVIQPGVVTTDAVQRELVADLRRTRATLVRWSAPEATRVEANGAGRERGSRRFDAFVTRGYRESFRTGPYAVLVPR